MFKSLALSAIAAVGSVNAVQLSGWFDPPTKEGECKEIMWQLNKWTGIATTNVEAKTPFIIETEHGEVANKIADGLGEGCDGVEVPSWLTVPVPNPVCYKANKDWKYAKDWKADREDGRPWHQRAANSWAAARDAGCVQDPLPASTLAVVTVPPPAPKTAEEVIDADAARDAARAERAAKIAELEARRQVLQVEMTELKSSMEELHQANEADNNAEWAEKLQQMDEAMSAWETERNAAEVAMKTWETEKEAAENVKAAWAAGKAHYDEQQAIEAAKNAPAADASEGPVVAADAAAAPAAPAAADKPVVAADAADHPVYKVPIVNLPVEPVAPAAADKPVVAADAAAKTN